MAASSAFVRPQRQRSPSSNRTVHRVSDKSGAASNEGDKDEKGPEQEGAHYRGQPGVYFFSLDASSLLAVTAAR